MSILQQSWFHVEDKARGSNGQGRLIRQIIDIYSDQDYFDLKSLDKRFVELRVKSRNANREIGFIEYSDFVRINFGPLSSFPDARLTSIRTGGPMKHVKLEISYIQTNADFFKPDHFYNTGYLTSYEVEGPIQIEFSIILPLGLKLENNGKDLKILLFDRCDRENCDNCNEINCDNGKLNLEPLFCHDPFVKGINGKNSYHYIIKKENHDKILKRDKPWIEVYYKAINKPYYFSFSIFGAILASFSFYIYYLSTKISLKAGYDSNLIGGQNLTFLASNSQLQYNLVTSISLTFLIVSLSFTILFFTLSFKEGYKIPYKGSVIVFIVLNFVFLFLTYLRLTSFI